MKPLRVVLAVLAFSVPTSARAALIGLAGVDYDPPPINITQPGPFTVEPCSNHTESFDGGYCVFYNAFADVFVGDEQVFAGFDSIFSFDFELFDAQGQVITEGLDLDEKNTDLPFIAPSQFSENGFHLSGATIFPTEPCEGEFCPPVIDAIAFYLFADATHPNVSQFQVRTLAVNDVSVPEPATLLLLGPAGLMLLARRRMRRAALRKSA